MTRARAERVTTHQTADHGINSSRAAVRHLATALAIAGALACAALVAAGIAPNEPAVLVVIACAGLFVALLRRLTSLER